jgi:hypothetical protein
MQRRTCVWLALLSLLFALAGCGGSGGSSGVQTPTTPPTPPVTPVNGPPWWQFARDAVHSALGAVAAQALNRVVWSTPVDLAPQIMGNELLIHYGSPVMTSDNTVMVPVKTTATGGFAVQAYNGANGAFLWSAASDYVAPPHDWMPSFNPAMTQSGRLYMPGSGGKLLFRDASNSPFSAVLPAVFYGPDAYTKANTVFDSVVFVNTPISIDSAGNIFFGFMVTGANPAGLVSGIARIGADGNGSWIGAAAAAGDAAISKVAMNSAPAVSADLNTLYVTVNVAPGAFGAQPGYLLALDSTTLTTRAKMRLLDPATGAAAYVTDDATASPTVGPDGDVFIGVLESNFPGHNGRGWLLHFDAALSQVKIPGSFGWDDTASIVPAASVPSYNGGSAYLIATKYNNYADAGTGDGKNRMAVLDPGHAEADLVLGIPVMNEVLTVLSVTPDPGSPRGFTEWCINTAAVDPITKSILVGNEDGNLYRWDLTSNQLTQKISITSGIGEAYTPTMLGPDGTVYAINNAKLFAVGN